MPVSVRRAAVSDAAKIAELESAYVDCPWSKEQVADEILDDKAVFLVADDGGVVGFLSGVCAADECEISNIAVEESHRRRGIATRLFTELIALTALRGVKNMFLLVRSDNAPATALYGSLGFKKVGRRAGYYGGADAVIMRLEL